MSDNRLNPNYRGEKCPTCGEWLPMLFCEECSACNAESLKQAKAEIERLTSEHSDMNLANVEYEKVIERLTAENERMREALEEIALGQSLSVEVAIAQYALKRLEQEK